ncbi:MAG TPA: type II and III secretion system protein family protein [Roseiarcus sp.]|jgi:pilus assembly protein CpaC|nr:type II and III secretion system protein family protein [Roseiarcus sp.]
MTEGGVSKKEGNSFRPRMRVREGLAASSQRRVWVAMLATVGAAAAGFGLVQASGPAWSQKGGPCHAVREQVSDLKVTLNKARTLCFSAPFSTAVIGAPEIADVLPMTDSMLYVQGKKVGATNISVFDQQRRLVSVIDLDVTPDTTSLQSKIAASTGGRDINVTSANGEIVLSGEASDGLAAARAVEVAKGLSPDAPVVNAMKVPPSQQVMLKVRILEVDRNAGRDLGVNWTGKTNSVSFATGLGALTTTATNNSGVFPGAGSTASSFGVLLANIVNTHGVGKGLVKSLAEPDLVALSGAKATFLAGGEIPVPVVQGTNATNGTLGIGTSFTPNISIEWKQFGVGLDFTPTVLNNGIINLQLNPSVTEINTANSLNINGTTVPSLTERKAHTAVELRDGQSFAIAGLLQAQDSQSIDQLPWLGNVPVLGALFRSTDFQKSQTDLVIIVSPHLVRPVRPSQHLATDRSKGPHVALRSALAIFSLIGLLTVAGCSSTVGFDDPFADYLQRTALVSTTGGDAQAANIAMQTPTPWPRYANDTNIPANGARLVKVITRYEGGAATASASDGAAMQTTANPGPGATNGASTGMGTSLPAPSPGY